VDCNTSKSGQTIEVTEEPEDEEDQENIPAVHFSLLCEEDFLNE
jgi:hypothetical protein